MQQKTVNTREVIDFLIKEKKHEILAYEEAIKKCTEEIKEFEKMLETLKEEN